jgi:hypothetical protein
LTSWQTKELTIEPDIHEGMAAIREKRKPQFSARSPL